MAGTRFVAPASRQATEAQHDPYDGAMPAWLRIFRLLVGWWTPAPTRNLYTVAPSVFDPPVTPDGAAHPPLAHLDHSQ